MQKIIISVTNDLVSDNRVHKVATSLKNAGFDVLLVGRKLKTSKPIKREYATKRMRLIFKKSAFFYAEFNLRLFFFLLFHRSNMLLANDLDTLLPNFLVARIKRNKLFYDSHELFTEVPELINRKKVQKIWLKIEKFCLPKVKKCYTVNRSISDYYSKKYDIKMGVVRNIPFYINNKIKKEFRENKIIIYQGALNVGRGLEEAIDAMEYLENSELWLIGTGDIEQKLKDRTNNKKLNEKVKFFGLIPLEDLPKYTIQADLGLSIEKNMGKNYYFALPNKIFDYIQNNVPVLCADLPEMKKIIENYEVGEILKSHTPKQLAEQIKAILADNKKLKFWKENTQKAQKELCWQNEEKELLKIFE